MKKSNAPAPWLSVMSKLEKADVVALQMVAVGKATDVQQKRAIDVIINKFCETYGLSFRPDEDGGERATAFAEGKRFVGSELILALKSNMNNFMTKE